MAGSFSLGRIAGIQVGIHYSWLIILAFFTGALALGRFPQTLPGLSTPAYVAMGFAATLLLFASILAHEFGHALVARVERVPVKGITLFIFGGVATLAREPRTPGADFRIAIAGPLVSLVLGVSSWLLGGVAHSAPGVTGFAGEVLIYLGEANILLLLFNLIPGFPLDGGRVLRAALWKLSGSGTKATRWAARTGQGIGLLVVALGLWQVVLGNLATGLWLALIGWFLTNAARGAQAHVSMETALGGLRVADLMQSAPRMAPANISLRRLVDEYLLPDRLRVVPVEQVGYFAGVISVEEITRVPRERWEQTPVGHAMTPAARLPQVAAADAIIEVAPLLAQSSMGLLPVVEQGQLVGVLTGEAIVQALDLRQRLARIEMPAAEAAGPDAA